MKVLNLYAGIGGNRKLWQDVEVTAIEINPEISKIYQDFFPEDTVIVADAHQYLLDHYKEFDFIWSSPPCQTHSDIRRCGVHKGQYDAVFIDMKLYQEIVLLKHFFGGKYVIENVKPYYKPLITPSVEIHRHYFWSNFPITNVKVNDDRVHETMTGKSILYGFDLNNYNILNKRQIIRNMVNPEVANYILNCARKHTEPIQEGLFKKQLYI